METAYGEKAADALRQHPDIYRTWRNVQIPHWHGSTSSVDLRTYRLPGGNGCLNLNDREWKRSPNRKAKCFQRTHPSTAEVDGRGDAYGDLLGRTGTTNAARSNPNNEIGLQLGCRNGKKGRVGAFLDWEGCLNRTFRGIKTVAKSRSGPLND